MDEWEHTKPRARFEGDVMKVGKVVPVQLDEEKVREIIKEEMEKLRNQITEDLTFMLRDHG